MALVSVYRLEQHYLRRIWRGTSQGNGADNDGDTRQFSVYVPWSGTGLLRPFGSSPGLPVNGIGRLRLS